MATNKTESTEPVYFWKETNPNTGWLSQWYYCPFRDDKEPKIVYDTAEHYMMYHKAILFNDHKTASKVLKAGNHPRKVKTLGRQVSNFSETTWLAHREAIVRRGNILKFTSAVTEKGFCMGSSGSKASAAKLPPLQGSLRETLLRTGERELVEASPFDAIWGIGFRAADADAMRSEWGMNLLGKALMDVRNMLREEQENKEKNKEEKAN